MKMQRRGWINFIKVGIFLLIFVLCYLCLEKVLEGKYAFVKNSAFMEEEKDFDVLIMGNSHAVYGLYPMELWNQYGIFSFNLAGASNEIAVSYWELVNALDYTTPELVVLDCSRISSMDKVPKSLLNNIHRSFDFLPLSGNKIKAIYDLLEPEERMGFLWEISLYHSRWNDIKKSDFEPEAAIDKGAEIHVGAAIPDENVSLDKNEKSSLDTVGVEYLRKTIELCREREIDILLTFLPFPAKEEQVKEANLLYDIAKEYNINYINFLDMDIVDFDTDCYDSHSHLNPSGGRKVTEYLGAYVQENYDIKDRREDAAYSSWYADYEVYTEQKLNLIREQVSLDCELATLYDKNISTCIYIKENSEILQDERMVKLIKNVSPYVDLTQIETARLNKSEYFVAVDNGWCDIWESEGGEPLQDLGTTFGNVSYFSSEGMPSLFIQGSEESYLFGTNDAGEMPDVQIVTINKLTGEIVHRSAYSVSGHDEYGNIIANKVN